MTKTALILGGNGRFARHSAQALRAAGWTTRGFDRSTDDLMQAAKGADLIVAGWNPPYHLWHRQVLPLHQRVIAAAKASGATVLLPGNVYNFGEATPAPWGPEAPQAARNPLGRIRIEMEQAYRDSGVQTIILRMGDFIDTEASGNWFDMFIAKTAQKGAIRYPGREDIPHAWAYLPDAARAAAALADRREDLPVYSDIPFAGYTLTGRELAAALSRSLGRDVVCRQMAWWWLKPMRFVMPLLKGVLEMRYLWNTPHWLDAGPMARALPDFQSTPAQEALRAALGVQAPKARVAGGTAQAV